MSTEGAKKKRGALLLGFPRSGTTLLSRLLDAHPDVSAPPETYLMSSAARFLHEQKNVEGPSIGVLSGLNFLGFEADDVMEPLRQLVFGFHEQIAKDASLWIEKTATDVFHLETLEDLLAGHVKFVVMARNPLDVIASNLGLSNVMGAQLDDIFNMTKAVNSPHEGLAVAWADRARALRAFCERHTDAVCRVRYEDLTAHPTDTLATVFDFLGVETGVDTVIETAFEEPPRFGLGDFNFATTTGILPARKNAWRGKIPPAALSRVIPIVSEEMAELGYDVPKVPPIPTREDAVRQLKMAAALKHNSRGGPKE